MKYELVKRKISDLKPDPNQPRKSFKEEDIELLAQTYRSQGIINPIEIDINDIIITGEMRWRASKIAELKEIDCKLIKEINNTSRFLRQCIENFHHINLTEKEEREAIERLHILLPDLTQKDLGKKLGRSQKYISEILRLPQIEKELGSKTLGILGKRSTVAISESSKNIVEKRKIVKKAIEEKMTQPKVLELIKVVKKLPNDIKEEILKTKTEITIEEAKEIAEIPKLEMRKEAIKFVKKQKQEQELTREYVMKVAKEEIPMPKTYIDIDERVINQFLEVKKKVFIKMHIRNVESYNEHTQTKLKRIMKQILEYLQQQLKIEGEIINV